MPYRAKSHRPAARLAIERARLRSKDACQRFYKTQRWQKFRAYFLRLNPLCADCERQPATEVHHRLKLRYRPDLALDESNVVGLCCGCHSRRTAAERRGDPASAKGGLSQTPHIP